MANATVKIPADFPQSTQTLRDNIPRIAISCAVWFTLFFFMGWISRLLIPGVRTLKPKEKMYWQLAMARSVCGMMTFWAAYLAFFDGRLALDHVLASTDESWTFVTVLTGFFIFEELALIYFDLKYRTFSKELHMHHFFAFNGMFLSVWYNRGHFYAAKSFVLEASTIFSCICWCLLKLKLEKTKAWKINQWILINVFHLRSVHEMWWWYDVIHDWDHIKQNLPWPYTLNMLVGLSLVSFWLTPYWTYKKTVQFFHPTDWNVETNTNENKKEGKGKTS